MRLQNKVAIITGAGSGIGKAAAEQFSKEGAIVIVADLPTSGGEKVAEMILAEGGCAKFMAVDVSNAEQMQNLVDQTIKDFDRIDIMYNNAGLVMPLTAIEDVDEACYEQLMAVNMKGVFLGVRAVVPYMKRARKGVILSTASTSAVRPRPGLNIYCASKGAVVAFSKSVALELAPYEIRVNCLNPVATNTPMIDDELREVVIKNIPLGRLAHPMDIANAAVFLASDEAAMITGIDLEVDGGRCV